MRDALARAHLAKPFSTSARSSIKMSTSLGINQIALMSIAAIFIFKKCAILCRRQQHDAFAPIAGDANRLAPGKLFVLAKILPKLRWCYTQHNVPLIFP